MNNYGFKRNRNVDYLNGLRVPLSNSNHLIYSRQSSNNNISASSPSTSTDPSVQSPNRHSINICNNMLAQVKEQQPPPSGNRSHVQVEVHSPSEPQENKAKSSTERLSNNQVKPAVNRHLTFTKNQQIIKDEITQLNGLNDERRQSSSSEANSLNDQNLNCQLQARRKSSIPNGLQETELNDKTKRLRRYSEKDKDLNLPLLKQSVYHEYDQPENLMPIYDQSMNCCQNHLLNSNSLNIRKTSCNCNQRAMNGFNGGLNGGLNHVENGEDDERRSLV